MASKVEEESKAASGSANSGDQDVVSTPTKPRKATKVVTAHRQREGAGFVVRRPIGGEVSMVDPFLMLDHFGPVDWLPGEAVGAPDHPHRGFETVTYILDGEMQHKDSAGNHGVLKAGWVQWMTAGSGVVHSEMPSDHVLEKGGRSEGFQLWVNLPAKLKWTTPRYQDTPPEKMPIVPLPDDAGSVKVIAGTFMGKLSAIETHIPIVYMDVRLNKGGSVTIPVDSKLTGFAYMYRGGSGVTATAAGAPLSEGQMAMLGAGDGVVFTAPTAPAHFLLIAGTPIGEPVARYGPFVMNTREEIMQCFQDYEEGRMGRIAGAEERYAAAQRAVSKQKESGTWNKDERGQT